MGHNYREPEIRQLVPLRNVINEICKHQVSCKLPRITSFEKFYEKIEDECYEKLHFTNTSKQFYQERFCTDDGCMAIVFCNMEVVENITMCTLMYVDASFKIDTFEDFKYQLVTVLVWIDDSVSYDKKYIFCCYHFIRFSIIPYSMLW